MDDAPHQQAVARRITVRHHGPGRGAVRRHLKQGFEFGAFGPGADQPRGGPAAQQQIDGVDDDGFAGPGFAAENRQPRRQPDAQVLDNGEISDGQFLDHLFVDLRADGLQTANQP